MIKHIWSVLCRKSVIDNDSNNISLFDVFEQLGVNVEIKDLKKVPEKVNIPIDYEIVSLWLTPKRKKTIKADVEVEVVNPDQNQVKTFRQKLEIPPKFKRMRSRLRVKGLTIEKPGDYTFKVKIKEESKKDYKVVAELPLEVNLKKEKVKTKQKTEAIN